MPDREASFGVVIDPSKARSGARTVRQEFKSIGDESEKQQRRISTSYDRLASGLKRAFAGIGFALLIQQGAQLSDTFTNTQNRLKLVTDSTSELVSVQQELLDISNSSC